MIHIRLPMVTLRALILMSFPSLGQSSGRALISHNTYLSIGSDSITLNPFAKDDGPRRQPTAAVELFTHMCS